MSYTAEELNAKAKAVLEAMNNNDPRAPLLLMMLSMAVGLPQDVCMNKIRELAE